MMNNITSEYLAGMRAGQRPNKAPSGAGYWLITPEDAHQLARDFLENRALYFPAVRNGDVAFLFGSPVVEKAEGPIQFVLWCERCGSFLRWDGAGRCQRCYSYVPGAEDIKFADMMKAARERWPDIAEHPWLVGVSPSCTGLDMMMCDPVPLMADLPDRLLEKRPLIKSEHIDLEPVGAYWLGYGPQTQTLAIRQGVPA